MYSLLLSVIKDGYKLESSVVSLTCPGCGARVSVSQKECEWCHNPIIISSVNSVLGFNASDLNKYVRSYSEAIASSPNDPIINKSIGMCYLKLNLMDKAKQSFSKALEFVFDDSELFYLSAICSLNGKKAFLNDRKSIDQSIDYLNAAISVEEKGIYYYLMAYIKYDYFERKHFKTNPNYVDCLDCAKEKGVSDFDIEQLYQLLKVDRPSTL